jgi:iron complex outermembrane receptor protein
MQVTVLGYTGIRIRGTDGTRINVTLNGIPYNDAESQGSFFVDLPILLHH